MNPSDVDFLPERDYALLRSWVELLCKKNVASPSGLTEALARAKPNQEVLSRSTLERILQDERHGFRDDTFPKLKMLWEYLCSVPRYVQHFAEVAETSERLVTSMFKSADDLMAYALSRFFVERGDIKHQPNFAQMKQMLPGDYVMYRMDMEPACTGLAPIDTVRVSLLKIRASDETLTIEEEQKFKATPIRPLHEQTNTGVIAPYGKYMIGLLRTAEKLSFKCMVIKNYAPFYNGVETTTFRGKLMVASDLALFPSVHFFCKRITPGQPYQHGIYRSEEVDGDALAYITTPTFPEKYKVIP